MANAGKPTIFLSQWNQYSFFIARQFFTCRKFYILIVACNIILKHFLKLIIIILIKSTLHTQKNNFGMNKKNEDKIILIFESGWRQTYTRKIRKAKQKKNQVYTNMKKNNLWLAFYVSVNRILHLVDLPTFNNYCHFCFYSSLLQRNAHFVWFYEWNRELFFSIEVIVVFVCVLLKKLWMNAQWESDNVA